MNTYRRVIDMLESNVDIQLIDIKEIFHDPVRWFGLAHEVGIVIAPARSITSLVALNQLLQDMSQAGTVEVTHEFRETEGIGRTIRLGRLGASEKIGELTITSTRCLEIDDRDFNPEGEYKNDLLNEPEKRLSLERRITVFMYPSTEPAQEYLHLLENGYFNLMDRIPKSDLDCVTA